MQTAKSVRRQQRELAKQAASHAATAAAFCEAVGLAPGAAAALPPAALAAASAARGSRVLAARAMRELHKAQLQVEVATAEQVWRPSPLHHTFIFGYLSMI